MKTAMEEMLDWVRKTFPMDLDTPRMIEDKIELLIKKEKDQITEAYNQGTLDGESGIIFYPDYYFKTYNQNK